jgi:hypothetical protein
MLIHSQRSAHLFGLALNLVAIICSLGTLIGMLALVLHVPQVPAKYGRLFSVAYSLFSMSLAAMVLGYSRRILRRLFGR